MCERVMEYLRIEENIYASGLRGVSRFYFYIFRFFIKKLIADQKYYRVNVSAELTIKPAIFSKRCTPIDPERFSVILFYYMKLHNQLHYYAYFYTSIILCPTLWMGQVSTRFYT